MSSYVKKYGISAFLHFCLTAFLLSACGFEPVYGTRTRASGADMSQVSVVITPDVPEQRKLAEQLAYDLEQRLRPGGRLANAPVYALKAQFQVAESGLAVSRDGTYSRYNVTVSAIFSIERLSDGAVLLRDTAQRTGSYNNLTNAYFSTYVSAQDATERTITELAEDLRMRVVSFLAQPAEALKPLPAAAPKSLHPPVKPMFSPYPSANPFGL